MDVFEKIEQIRKKPEHIRRRYALVCVVISMVFVFVIWMMSLKSSFNDSEKVLDDESRLQIMSGLEEVKDIKDDVSSSYGEYQSGQGSIDEESAKDDSQEEKQLFNLSQ